MQNLSFCRGSVRPSPYSNINWSSLFIFAQLCRPYSSKWEPLLRKARAHGCKHPCHGALALRVVMEFPAWRWWHETLNTAAQDSYASPPQQHSFLLPKSSRLWERAVPNVLYLTGLLRGLVWHIFNKVLPRKIPISWNLKLSGGMQQAFPPSANKLGRSCKKR